MNISDYFVFDRTSDEQGQLSDSGNACDSRFRLFDGMTAPRSRSELQTFVNKMPADGYLGLYFLTSQPSYIQRFSTLLMMRRRLYVARNMLTSLGLKHVGDYGLYPKVENPTIVYQLNSPASRYAETHLLLAPSTQWAVGLHTMLHRLSGINPSLAAVITLGRRH